MKLKQVLAVAVFAGSLQGAMAWTITGAGSTFINPVMQRWALHFKQATGNHVNYQSIGSGGGILQVTKRTVDFGASDAPLTPEELKKRNLIQWPDAIGGVVMGYNIPGVGNYQLHLTGKQICDIYMGKVKYWDDPEIKATNPKLNLPHIPITPVHRADGSGTTWIFTNYLTKVCPAWAHKIGFSTSVAWPVGVGGKGNEGVTNYVMRIRGGIGYIEYAYYKQNQNRLKAAVLENKAGWWVAPTMQTMLAAAKQANWEEAMKHDFYMELPNPPGKYSYPIEGPTYAMLPLGKSTNSYVLQFYTWVFNHGDADLRALDYITLPDFLKKDIMAYWKKHGLSW
jgi:phosphate transport system substrate-binding protein